MLPLHQPHGGTRMWGLGLLGMDLALGVGYGGIPHPPCHLPAYPNPAHPHPGAPSLK